MKPLPQQALRNRSRRNSRRGPPVNKFVSQNRVWPAALGAVVMLLVCAACSADGRPSKVESGLANIAKEVVIPLEAKERKNALTVNNAAAKKGMDLYRQSCALCHGGDGRSNTPLGRGLYPPAIDLTSPHVKRWNDAELFWIIQNGVRLTGMPAWKDVFDDTQTWELVMAIRELQTAKPRPEASVPAAGGPQDLVKEGGLLFRQENCIGCHRLDGEGGGVGPDLSDEGNRGRTDAWLIGHFQNPSAYVPGSIMPPAANLNQHQLQALTAFLQQKKTPARNR